MNKKLPSWVMLCAVCLVGALALGLFNGLTAGGVDRQAAMLTDAVRDRALDADRFEALEVQESRYNLDSLYAAQDAEGAVQGYVGQTTVTGYGGPIEVTAGVDNDGVITGVSVGGEGFAETPGLGARTREAAFTDQFIGKTPTITLNEGGVDTVSGASTTSRAVVSAVNNVANYIYINQLGLAEETETAFMGQTFSATEKGFGGDVTVTLGLDDEGAVAYMAVDTPNETDGLGKLASEPAFTGQFIGKKGPFTYGEDGIEALSGATFTSTAVINAANTIVNGGGEASGGPLTATVQGFGGDVTLNVVLGDDNTVAALTIDTPNETDGLGKLTSEPAFTDQFIGKAAPFAYGEDGIEAVSGATVTSTAVINGLNDLLSGEAAPAAAPAAEPAEETAEAALTGDVVTVEKTTPFSTIKVEASVEGGRITAAKVTSEAVEGSVDMLTDDSRKALADQIIEKQDVVDAISGVTISSDAVKEAVAEILGQGAPAEEEAPAEEPAEEVKGETVTVEKTTDFSTIKVEAVVADGKIVDCKITSEGATDLLTDDSRKALADQIIEKQDVVDAISGVTISSDAVKEAVAEILGQGAPAEEAAPAEEVKGETITVEKTTDFSTIKVEAVVADGKIVDAKITSEGATDLLTDDSRKALANQIVEKQDVVDAITGVTISSDAVKEAVAEILGQGAPAEEEAPAEEPAEEVKGETITVEKTTDFSTIKVEAVVADGKIVDCKITSEGATDLLTDDSRKALADQIVEKQDVVDAITGVTISSEAVKEAVAEILGQQSAPAEEEAPAEEPAEEVKGETVTVEKTTDFSTIKVEAVVADGKIVDCKITSEGATDLLTDDSRKALADQIVEKQDVVDAITGVTISSNAIKEAVAEILGQQGASAEEAAPVEGEAPSEAVEGETITVEKTTDFSTIKVEAVVADGKIVDCKITSEGATDLLTDDSRKALADQIIEKQDVVDAITGVTISSDAIKEAVAEILGQGAPAEEEAPAEEPAEEVKGETVTVEKTTDFSTIKVEAVVADGKIVDCKITSEGATDLLTDDSRKALADQIVEKQDVVDAITGVTISSDAVKEAVAEILGH